LILDKLPQLANAIAQPLAKTDKIVIINSSGDPNSGAGASRVTKDVADTMAQLPAVIEALTGVRMIDLLNNLPVVKNAIDGAKPQESAPVETKGS